LLFLYDSGHHISTVLDVRVARPMTTLIERLEAAEAGSGELNVLAHAEAVNPDIMVDGGGYRGEREVKYAKMADILAGGFPAKHLAEYAPTYTDHPYDLTAAMGLVPEGWVLHHIMWLHDCWLATLTKEGSRVGVAVDAATPALALTAAALRAKEIEDGTHGVDDSNKS
jgi:hypothetical protein